MVSLFKSKIFIRQFLSFFLIICITFLTISFTLLTITRISLAQQQYYAIENYRMQASQSIMHWYTDLTSYLKVQALCIAQLGQDKIDSGEVYNIINEQISWNKYVGDIVIVDDKGMRINSIDGPGNQSNIAGQAALPAGGAKVGPPPGAEGALPPAGDQKPTGAAPKGFHKGPMSKDPIMAIPIPFDVNGRRYTLIGIIGLERVKEIVEKLKFGDWGHAYLVNSEGMFITDSRFIKEFIKNGGIADKEKYKINSLAVEQVMEKKQGTRSYTDFMGQQVFGSYEWLDPLEVGLIVEFRVSESMKPIDDLMRVIGLLAVLVVVIGIVLAFLLSRRVIYPIGKLISATENIISQNYHESLDIKTGSELDILIKNFNSMQAAIRAREEQLQKKNEELKVQTAAAMEASKLKSQFLANMSHELRTPLNSIIGFTGRVIKKSAEVLAPVQVENLRIVKEEAQHLLDLINSLLDYSKIEAGKMEVYMEDFDLAQVVEEVYNMVKTLIEDKPIKYTYEMNPAGKCLIIHSDRMKVKQILINLLSNAFKYSQKGNVRLLVEKEDLFYRITVQDEGIGISPENLKHIFDEFRQVDGSYTRKVGGTGLGLSITRRFIEMLGGRIEVNSTPNVGSCFTVYLPADNSGNSENEPGTEIFCRKKAVCVDDDPNVHRLYKQFLEEHGFEVIALDGQGDTVQKILEAMPDIILLDIMLPQRDGWELLAELKDTPQTKKIPVIMMSVLSEKNLAYKMRADDYIVKPVTQHELVDAIIRNIARKEKIEVLVADDDENYLNLVGQFLKDEAIPYRVARNGEEVLRLIEEKKPDLLLLDIMMPNKDGFTVIEEIRKKKELENLPIVIVTAKILSAAEKEVLRNRASLVVEKSGIHIEKVMEILLERMKEKVIHGEDSVS